MASDSPRRLALMSIRPRFARLIMVGKKKVEFRKVKFREEVSHIVIYATAPVQRVVGYFDVAYVDEDSPKQLWNRYGMDGGISYDELRVYYAYSSRGIAIGIGKVRVFRKPVSLSAVCDAPTPPQSVTYLRADAFETIRTFA